MQVAVELPLVLVNCIFICFAGKLQVINWPTPLVATPCVIIPRSAPKKLVLSADNWTATPISGGETPLILSKNFNFPSGGILVTSNELLVCVPPPLLTVCPSIIRVVVKLSLVFNASMAVLIALKLTSSVATTTLCVAADLLPLLASTSVPAIFAFTFK